MLRGEVAGDGLEEGDGSISPIRFLFGSCVLGLGLGWAGLGWAGAGLGWAGWAGHQSWADTLFLTNINLESLLLRPGRWRRGRRQLGSTAPAILRQRAGGEI